MLTHSVEESSHRIGWRGGRLHIKTIQESLGQHQQLGEVVETKVDHHTSKTHNLGGRGEGRREREKNNYYIHIDEQYYDMLSLHVLSCSNVSSLNTLWVQVYLVNMHAVLEVMAQLYMYMYNVIILHFLSPVSVPGQSSSKIKRQKRQSEPLSSSQMDKMVVNKGVVHSSG